MRFSKVAVGGTFDFLHKGHRALLKRAFEVGENVIIGITSDELLSKNTSPLKERLEGLQNYLRKDMLEERAEMVVLKDTYGPAADDPSIEALVITRETVSRGKEINRIRIKKGIPELKLIEVPLVSAKNGSPISSTRIRKKEIDSEGRTL